MANDIYYACSENAKDLKKQRKRLLSLTNRAIREKNDADLCSLTKLYTLLYSAYAEVSLLKLIHSPNAFTESEIHQITSGRNLEEKWKKCVELAFSNLNTSSNTGTIANKKQTLLRILDKYIIQPSQIRNKVAHGQWIKCLNSDGSRINSDVTAEMLKIDFVKIDRLFCIYEKFQQCILDLSVSPKTHYRDYYTIITNLDEYIAQTSTWNLESKKHQILTSSKIKRFQNRQ